MNRSSIRSLPCLLLFSSIPALANGVQFSCDPSITNDGPAGLCNYLNSQIDPLYNNTFTNANADIYIEFANNDGLADSSPQVVGTIDYSGYQTTLEAESTDPAKAFVPAAEPGIFGGDVVEVTSALAQALGLATFGGTLDGQVCYTPGSNGCYNGIIQLNIPADLKTEQDQGYDYPGLSGSTTGTTENYDILSVVEHETDEILGTASCIETTGDNNTELENPLDCASAVDLFRYTSAGELTFDTPGVSAYFSPDGGVTASPITTAIAITIRPTARIGPTSPIRASLCRTSRDASTRTSASQPMVPGALPDRRLPSSTQLATTSSLPSPARWRCLASASPFFLRAAA